MSVEVLILSDPLKPTDEERLRQILLKIGITDYQLWYDGGATRSDAKCVVDIRRGQPFTKRGSVYIDPAGVPYMATFAMEELNKCHWYLPVMLRDLDKVRRIVQHGYKPLDYRIEVTSDPGVVDIFLNNVSKHNDLCALDIETTFRGGDRIRCIGFSAIPEYALVVKTEGLEHSTYFELLDVFKKWMTGTSIRWVGQNGYGFDINYILRQWNFEIKNYVFDTMVGHHLLAPELPHDLAFLTSMYTDIPYYKDTSEKDLYNYNGLDCISTITCAKEMIKELEHRKLMTLYRDYYHKLLTPLREMSLRGIKVDKEYQKELKSELKREVESVQEGLDRAYQSYGDTTSLERKRWRAALLLGSGRKTVLLRGKRKRLTSLIGTIDKQIAKVKSLNVRSPKSMAEFLYKTLKLKPQKKQGKITTDESAINKLYIESGNPILKDMIKLRQLEKCMSDYGNMKTDEDERVRTVYKFVETGRLSSGKFEAK